MTPNVSSLDADVAQKLAGTLHPDITLCDVRLKDRAALPVPERTHPRPEQTAWHENPEHNMRHALNIPQASGAGTM
jgi:hypothetical protein